MNRTAIAIVAIAFATTSFAESKGSGDLQAITYNDGVLIESIDESASYQIKVSGVGNSTYFRSITATGYLFLDASDENGPLADGLYKYEARPIPSFTISREESSKLRDRNILVGKSVAKTSPLTGSFRVLNGEVVDSMLKENHNNVSEGDSE